MMRRLHTTEIGCIAGEYLTDFGAGKEGWLVDNPNLLVSLGSDSLAIADRSLILLLSLPVDGRPDSGNSKAVKIIPELSPIEAEYLSAIEWLVFDGEIRVLAVGTSSGYLLLFSIHGSLLHRQFVSPLKILKLRVCGDKQDPTQVASSQGVCIVMPGVIAYFEGSDIKNLLQQKFQETTSLYWDHEFNDYKNSGLPYQIWNVNKYGICADAAITGDMPPPLMEIQSSRYYCAVTIGDDAVIAAYRLSVDKSRSIVGAILSKVVPATFSTIASFSKLIWRSEMNQKRKQESVSQPSRAASTVTCIKDHPRKGEKLTVSPTGTLMAVTDSLGRILLLDTRALVVVRLWKGYREASCLFVEMLGIKDKSGLHEYRKSDHFLCLAIHAPRKGIVEVWRMRTGPRLLIIPCPKGCRMLQPAYRFSSSATEGSSSSSSSSSSSDPLQLFFLNGDSGEVSVLNQKLY
ncbi:hypothetical protein M569_13648, partial [Genlisea aurea]